jgi:peptidoglycan/xylan/chitin deacetylase (PgdA/CDA1 family)
MGRWEDLRKELDGWLETGRIARFWWRDDDADAAIPSLVQLLDLADEFQVPLCLAAIPDQAADSLVREIFARPGHVVAQHGVSHRNHAPPGQHAVECGGERPAGRVLADLEGGRRRLEDLFGLRFQPILVPPWNRIAPELVEELPACGYKGLSAFGMRTAGHCAAGLASVNTHFDVLKWRGGTRFAGREKIIAEIVRNLGDRRSGRADASEPIGLLTHHQVHDTKTWGFLREILQFLVAPPAVRWVHPGDAFGLAPEDRRPEWRAAS